LGKSREEKMRIHVNPISNDNVIYSHNSEFSASSIAEKLIEELEKDPKIRKRLAELMVTDSDVRLAIINAVLADVATKSDLEKLEAATRRELEKLEERLRNEIQREVRRLEDRISALEDRIAAFENRVNSIEERLTRLEGQMDLFVKLFIAFNLPTSIAVIGILLKMVFS
jgi:predicted ribosome quality control (RQC) complex YloA/Tae2 family protein